jgi:hypothetical protein
MITNALGCSQSVSDILLGHLWMAWLDMTLPVPRLQGNLQLVNGVIHHVRHARLSVVLYLCRAPRSGVESTAIFANAQGFDAQGVYFHHVTAVTRRHQAKSWELWAAMSLRRLWQRQGKRDQTGELLAPLYG